MITTTHELTDAPLEDDAMTPEEQDRLEKQMYEITIRLTRNVEIFGPRMEEILQDDEISAEDVIN